MVDRDSRPLILKTTAHPDFMDTPDEVVQTAARALLQGIKDDQIRANHLPQIKNFGVRGVPVDAALVFIKAFALLNDRTHGQKWLGLRTADGRRMLNGVLEDILEERAQRERENAPTRFTETLRAGL